MNKEIKSIKKTKKENLKQTKKKKNIAEGK
jgi:hypothetical protein